MNTADKNTTRRKTAARLRFETLEDRRLLAGDPELLKDINGGPNGSSARNFVEVGSTTYFTAFDPTGGNELWKTDGTSSGTVRVKDISPGNSSSYPRLLTNVNGTLFLVPPMRAGVWSYGRATAPQLGLFVSRIFVPVRAIRLLTISSTSMARYSSARTMEQVAGNYGRVTALRWVPFSSKT